MRLEDKLEAMAQDFEQKAAAIRMTAQAITTIVMSRAKVTLNGKLRKAVTIERNGNGHALVTQKKGFSYQGTHWTQRPENKAKVAALYRRGKRKRTIATRGKTYTSENGHRVPPSLKKQRTRSANLLARFNASEPIPLPKGLKSTTFAPLVRYGYLEKQGDGYVRTSKEFVA